MIIVNGWKPLTIIKKCSILDVAAALYPPLNKGTKNISLENQTHHKWSENTTFIVGDYIILVLKKIEYKRQWRRVKVKSFAGATNEDMYNYIKPLLKKFPKNILYIGTNNTVKETSGTVLDNLLSLKDNSNTSNAGLSRRGLHLNSQGLDKLAINFIKKIKSFKRS